jgi:superoxide dismutase, Cu-Zn family
VELNRWTARIFACFLLTALWGCPPPEEAPEGLDPTIEEEPPAETASARMIDRNGNEVGIVVFTEQPGGVRIAGSLRIPGVPPTLKGFHVHEVGVCEPPDFESAEGHFNPQGHPHGGPDDPSDERHTGDLGNVHLADDGAVEIDQLDDAITLGEGPNDIIGRSLMIHAEEDDLETQPTGDAGERIACGVIMQ